jgi:hypothetical protein
MACRERYGLPHTLAVIYFHDDEICWCLGGTAATDGELPVVSYDIHQRRLDKTLALSFEEFFDGHLALYAAPAS